MKLNNIYKVVTFIFMVIIFTSCSSKLEYFDESMTVFKKRSEVYQYTNLRTSPDNELRLKYKNWKKKVIDEKIYFDSYKIVYKRVEPYFVVGDNYVDYTLTDEALKPKVSWLRKQGFLGNGNYRDEYTFMMFTLNQEPFNKKLLPYFNMLNTSFEDKVKVSNINGFVNYKCDENIIFSKYEKYGLKGLIPTKECFAKRLDKDVFLIARFAYPVTKEDTELFQNEIIPTILKSVKVTPTKMSLWKYY